MNRSRELKMTIWSHKRNLLVGLMVFSALAATTSANTVEIAHVGYGSSSYLNIWGGGHSGLQVVGGVYMLEKTGGTGIGEMWPDGLIPSFCAELTQETSDEPQLYSVVPPESAPVPIAFLGGFMGPVKADFIRELWARYYDPAWAVGPETIEEKQRAEAFHAAIWEIIYESLPATPLGWDVKVDGTPGPLGFACINADRDLANEWLHSLTGEGPMADLMAFISCGYQDFIVEIPEPATIGLLVLGGMSLLARRRTIRRRA